MLTGTISLDFDSEVEESHYFAMVTQAIVSDDKIALDFKGHHPDEGSFSGHCCLERQGAAYTGDGHFRFGAKSYGAKISATRHSTADGVRLAGEWTDDGEVEAYTLSVILGES